MPVGEAELVRSRGVCGLKLDDCRMGGRNKSGGKEKTRMEKRCADSKSIEEIRYHG